MDNERQTLTEDLLDQQYLEFRLTLWSTDNLMVSCDEILRRKPYYNSPPIPLNPESQTMAEKFIILKITYSIINRCDNIAELDTFAYIHAPHTLLIY